MTATALEDLNFFSLTVKVSFAKLKHIIIQSYEKSSIFCFAQILQGVPEKLVIMSGFEFLTLGWVL